MNPLSEDPAPQKRKKARNPIVLWFSILLAGILLYFALRELDWAQFFAILQNARYGWLPILFGWSSLSYLMRALRWRLLVQSEGRARLQDVFFANMAGYLGNNILPARAGEVIRAAYLSRKTGLSASFILATGLVERLVDVAALIVIGASALSLTGITSAPFQKALTVMSLFGAVGMGAILLLPRFGSSLERLVGALPLPGKTFKTRLTLSLRQFLRGLESLFNLRRGLGFGLLTLLVWLTDAASAVFSAYILGIPLTLLQAFVLLAGLGLSSALPSTPGYVGIYQFVAVLVLVPFGISNAEAVAYIIFAQIFGLLLVAVWGANALWQAAK